jgi:hypothetical protein
MFISNLNQKKKRVPEESLNKFNSLPLNGEIIISKEKFIFLVNKIPREK